ncbi:MAG: hypothetical protein HY225_03515 [Candidatus Vogelbacteria bacterium]|nr:hypothetical protein [Candidatus Vogelbacteria bacterium]
MGFDRTITPESLIDTKGLAVAAVLAALYNAAVKMGHGTKDLGPDTITESDAETLILEIWEKGYEYIGFDYLNGKRLKLDLTNAEESGIIAGQYDYGFGRGTAKRAIEILRSTGDPCHPDIIELQVRAAVQAAIVSAPLKESGKTTEGTFGDAIGLGSEHNESCYDQFGQWIGCRHIGKNQAESSCTTYNL